MKGESLRHVNKLVDLYNVVSLEHILPVGGEDLAAISGDIVLARAGANEVPVRLLGEKEERPPKPGEVFYPPGSTRVRAIESIADLGNGVLRKGKGR